MPETDEATAARNALVALGIEVPEGATVTMEAGTNSYQFTA